MYESVLSISYQAYKVCFNRIIIVTMFVNAENIRLSGRVVPPLAAGRSPTNEF